ncbi:MAG: hypothetical protein CVU97_00895 [Firmicutes bacterium HGW-Firmicutes-21]|nr:MAG: hypothetical protein CVU97_00895 [Firmicutes bacterium HGW-Firmicutes-21]
MTKVKKISTRLLVGMLAFTLLATGALYDAGGYAASALVESVGGSDSLVRTSLAEIKNILTSVVYSDYLKLHADVKDGETEIQLALADYISDETTATVNAINGYGGADGIVLLIGDDGKISWNVDIEEDALYSIFIEYYSGNIEVADDEGNIVSEGKSTSIERMVLIDNKVPFKEARSIVLTKEWADEYTHVDKNGKPILDENGKKTFYKSNTQEFIDLILKYENNIDGSERLFLKDSNGNEIRPDKALLSTWTDSFLYDSTGYYNNPLKFYFKKGANLLTLQTIKEPMAVKKIVLMKSEAIPTYDEYLEQNANASDYDGDKVVMIQAEYPTIVSERTIYQLNDRSSTITIPQDAALIRLNQIGGDKWQYVGQWIEWVIDVPEDGFYNIIPRSKQNIYDGSYVSRRIYIDGSVPFEEASYLRFSFSDNWQTKPLGDGSREFKFYLEKGKRTIRLEVVLGDMAEILSIVENSLTQINAHYRKILMITGPKPDEYRDYRFERLIPDVVKGLKAQAEILNEVSDKLRQITGDKGEHTATLNKIAVYLERMGTYPVTIAGSMSTLKDYLGALGTWLTSTQNQPLYLDYICIQSVNADPPVAEPGFFKSLWGEIQKFFMSFFADYNSIGTLAEGITSADVEAVAIEVWTATSREQAQIIRALVDDNFSAKYNIPVTVKLVVGGTLLPATLAGTGPDVSMGNGPGDPVNYAIRSAVKSLNTTTGNTNIGYNFNDLSQWADHPIYSSFIDDVDSFDVAKQRFAPATMTPITLYGETYALPENMSFSMMFYRKDIFVELGIDVPNTWDDFYDIIYTLQANMLDIGFPAGTAGSMILMYQQNDTLFGMGDYDRYMDLYYKNGYTDESLKDLGYTYTDIEGNLKPKTDGMKINLDSDISLASFKEVCQLFTMYDFPVVYSFPNRFRQGTMPLAIMDYTSYNQLIVFAPEIKGLWEFTPLPGTLSPDGSINNTTLGSISTMIMMRSVTDENAFSAWTYMQWWTSAQVQSAYGNEMVALLGPSAKQNTANLEALENMAWSKDEYDNLRAQFNAVQCVPEFPGSYIIGRYANFAFLGVYNDGDEPVEKLLSYIIDINNELTRKRREFGLPTAEDFAAFEKNLSDKQ